MFVNDNSTMRIVKNYLSLIKFSHTIFALPFAMIGFFIGVISLNPEADASGPLSGPLTGLQKIGSYFSTQWPVFFLVIFCMIFARSAAMAFNRFLDRSFDAKNPRTAIREIPAGVIPAGNALFFTVVMSVLFMTTTWFINPIFFLTGL